MAHFTSNTYSLKREILTFSNKISKKLSKPQKKFSADMTYGMLASGSCLLTDIVDQLHEGSKKINSVDRLSKHLDKGAQSQALKSYLSAIRKWIPDEPVVHIDDSDIIKPDGRKFEALGIVRDSSKSTDTKNVYEKGCHVTEACVLTKNAHPVSIFSKIHSSKEKDFTSANDVAFSAMNTVLPFWQKTPSSWTGDMTTIRCFLSLTVWDRIMSSVLPQNANSFSR